MFTVMRRKTFIILAVLLICTITAALLECQVHTDSSEDEHAAAHEHAAPVSHHHRSSSHATGHGACLIAVLPTAVFLVWFTFVWFQVSLRLVCLIIPTFPPFIPPKAAAH